MSWTLNHGDCLDPVSGLASLPDRSVDHVITDPPYEAEAHTLARPGDLVCDPFAGSGTTGIAASMRGCNFIGWERDPEYAEVAKRRLAGDEARPQQGQPSLFGGAA